MSTLKVNTITDGSSSFNVSDIGNNRVRAWVNFKGTDTLQIRNSFNVSSVVDMGVGLYDVRFATPMPHANYAISAMARQHDNTTSSQLFASFPNEAYNTMFGTDHCYIGTRVTTTMTDAAIVTFAAIC